MPKRFVTYSRTEPARTILWSVSLLTGILLLGIAPVEWGLYGVLMALPALGICGWGVWSSTKNSVRQMGNSSFGLFLAWVWAFVHVAITATSTLLWAPMLLVCVVLATVYIYLAHQQKAGTHE